MKMQFRYSKKKILHETRISMKIAFIFVLLLGIFSSILLMRFLRASYRESREYAEMLSQQSMNTISKNVTTLVNNVAYYSRLIISDQDILNALEDGTIAEAREHLYQMVPLIDFETHISGIYIMDLESQICSIDRTSVRTLRSESLSDIKWYDDVLNLKGAYCLKANADRVLTGSTAQPVVSMIRAIINPLNYQEVGILLINIDLEAFDDCCSSIRKEDVPDIYILDQTGQIVYSRAETKLPELQKVLNGKTMQVANNRVFSAAKISTFGWKILTGVPIKRNQSNLQVSSHSLIQSAEVLFLFCVISYLVVNYFVGKPLRDFVAKMNHLQGKQFKKIKAEEDPLRSCQELAYLSKTYNEMVDSIDRLVKQVYAEERIKRKAELNVLHEQIKPHFLYNTIDALTYLAMSGQNEKLCDSLEAFGGYYRTLLSKGRELITVRDEIEMVKDYLELQKLRYGKELSYELKIEERINSFGVLKMILQPFVENSVNHGIRMKGTSGKVTVYGKLLKSSLYFCVQDDGVGMNHETLQNLCKNFIEKNEASFGVRGTIERMKAFYETDITYEIRSNEKGTVIWFLLPIKVLSSTDPADESSDQGRRL